MAQWTEIRIDGHGGQRDRALAHLQQVGDDRGRAVGRLLLGPVQGVVVAGVLVVGQVDGHGLGMDQAVDIVRDGLALGVAGIAGKEMEDHGQERRPRQEADPKAGPAEGGGLAGAGAARPAVTESTIIFNR